MKHRLIRTMAFIVLGGSSSLFGQEGKVLNLDDLITEALENNPQLQAARHQAGAAQARADGATSWEAPQVGVEFFQTPIQSFPNPAKNWMENDYFIQQTIPFPGKLSAAGNSAENGAAMAEQGSRALERKVIGDVKAAYYDLYLVQRKIQINADNQGRMRQFVEIARKQYEVGTGQHHEVLRAQVELSTLVNEGVILQKEKRSAEAMLNTLLSRRTDSPLGEVPDPDAILPPWTFDQLSRLAMESRPEIRAMQSAVAMHEAELSMSKREYLPDLMIRLTYKDIAHTGNDYWGAMVGINLPIAFWSAGRYSSRAEENALNVRASEEQLATMRNTTQYEVQEALVKVQANYNLLTLNRNTVVPQARQTLESTIMSYQTGTSMFLWLLDGYRTLLDAQLTYYQAVADYMKSLAELERAVGLSMEEIRARIP